jgi:hypothetical protein
MTDTEAPAPARRGRPRPQETQDRDAGVLANVQAAGEAGTTRDAVAAALGLEKNQVYLSFYRLKRDGQITRQSGDRRNMWTAVPQA